MRFQHLNVHPSRELATRCNTLQHTATHCNTLQHTATLSATLSATHPATAFLMRKSADSTLRWPFLSYTHAATRCNTFCNTHCNSLSDEEVCGLNIPTAIPLVYKLDKNFKPVKVEGAYGILSGRYACDPEVYTATHCNTLQQHTATRCNTLQHTARHPLRTLCL